MYYCASLGICECWYDKWLELGDLQRNILRLAWERVKIDCHGLWFSLLLSFVKEHFAKTYRNWQNIGVTKLKKNGASNLNFIKRIDSRFNTYEFNEVLADQIPNSKRKEVALGWYNWLALDISNFLFKNYNCRSEHYSKLYLPLAHIEVFNRVFFIALSFRVTKISSFITLGGWTKTKIWIRRALFIAAPMKAVNVIF